MAKCCFIPLLILLLKPLDCVSLIVEGTSDAEVSSAMPQIRNIVEALVGAGDFGSWANILFGINPSTIPRSSTFFVPGDKALLHVDFRSDFDPSIIEYHVVPQKHNFTDLLHFRRGDRLPTLLSNNKIVITNNSEHNFTIDGVLITVPDLYNGGNIAVHGIEYLFNYSLYGSVSSSMLTVTESEAGNVAMPVSPTSPPPTPRQFDASCHCTESPPLILSAAAAICIFKILRELLR